jgi:hypothetical protein
LAASHNGAGGAGRMTRSCGSSPRAFRRRAQYRRQQDRHGISRSLLMTWRRSFGPEPIGLQGEQSGFARVVIAAEVEPAVAARATSGQMVVVVLDSQSPRKNCVPWRRLRAWSPSETLLLFVQATYRHSKTISSPSSRRTGPSALACEAQRI